MGVDHPDTTTTTAMKLPLLLRPTLLWAAVVVASAATTAADAGPPATLLGSGPATSVYIDSTRRWPSQEITSALEHAQGPGPWSATSIASAIYEFIGTARLRAGAAQIDTLVDTLVRELGPSVSTATAAAPAAQRLALARAARRARDDYKLATTSPSQLGADFYALSRLPPSSCSASSPRYFVDAGAHHYFRGSNSWLLEQAGWTGVAIDANPLSAMFERTRPRTRYL